jgi:hypothetical protein
VQESRSAGASSARTRLFGAIAAELALVVVGGEGNKYIDRLDNVIIINPQQSNRRKLVSSIVSFVNALFVNFRTPQGSTTRLCLVHESGSGVASSALDDVRFRDLAP